MHETAVTSSSEHQAAFVARLRRRDPAAFEELVRAHTPALLRVAQRVLRNDDDAQDALQSALLSAYRSIDRFEAKARVSTWLHRIVANASLGLIRFRRYRRERSLERCLTGIEPELRVGWDPDAALLHRQQRSRLHAAIGRLPASHRHAIEGEIAGLSVREYAARLGITVNAAKLRRLRARKRLSDLVDQGA